jgi:hypothetical protein
MCAHRRSSDRCHGRDVDVTVGRTSLPALALNRFQDSHAEGCGAKIGSKAYLTPQQLWDESGRHVKLG